MDGFGKIRLHLCSGRCTESNLQMTQKNVWEAGTEDFRARAICRRSEEAFVVFLDVVSEKEEIDGEEGICLSLPFLEQGRFFMAVYRHKEYWCQPFWTEDVSEIPAETQALLWQRADGEYGFLLPVCAEKYKAVVKGDSLQVFSRYDGLSECKSAVCVMAEGKHPQRLIKHCVEAGLSTLGKGFPERSGRRYPELFEYLGWCSWDAFQIRVGEKGLLEKCREFKEKDIPARWMIIDDMWGDVRGLYDTENPSYEAVMESRHDTTLYSFEADPYRFPKGLAHCISSVKKEFGMKVGIWHPINGYWSGIDREGPLAEQYGDCLIEGDNGNLVPDWHTEGAFRFLDAYHSFLESCGASFVKVDNQSTIERFYRKKTSVGEAAEGLHRALEASVGIHFDNRLINCMGMASENIWHRPISAISRCSDDFLPDNREWFTHHILQCAFNTLLQGEFLWCDWDMWWSSDSQAVRNSVLRAVSGGPVYVSDRLQESCREVIMPLVLADGRILRCDCPAVPTTDCLMVDPRRSDRPLKVYSRCGQGAAIAIFCLKKGVQEMEGELGTEELEEISDELSYVVYEYFSGNLQLLEKGTRLHFSLAGQDDFRLYLLVPVEDGFAPIGLKKKYIAPKTILDRQKKCMVLAEGGDFLFYSKEPVKNIWVNGARAAFDDSRAPLYQVTCRGNEKQFVIVE